MISYETAPSRVCGAWGAKNRYRLPAQDVRVRPRVCHAPVHADTPRRGPGVQGVPNADPLAGLTDLKPLGLRTSFVDYPLAFKGGKVTAKGGSSNTTAGEGAAGIGGGAGGEITISGGTVIATGGINGAGIGGGYMGTGGSINISDGTVTANAGYGAAGIGDGCRGASGTITISGGTVNATGGDRAPGIGSGMYAGSATGIIINGVTVTGNGASGTVPDRGNGISEASAANRAR